MVLNHALALHYSTWLAFGRMKNLAFLNIPQIGDNIEKFAWHYNAAKKGLIVR